MSKYHVVGNHMSRLICIKEAKHMFSAPSLYPVEVTVYSNTRESVFITWRGVSTRSSEEALEGYKVSHKIGQFMRCCYLSHMYNSSNSNLRSK